MLNNNKYIVPKDKLEKAKRKLDRIIGNKVKYKVKKNNVVFSFDNEEELNDLIKFIENRGE